MFQLNMLLISNVIVYTIKLNFKTVLIAYVYK